MVIHEAFDGLGFCLSHVEQVKLLNLCWHPESAHASFQKKKRERYNTEVSGQSLFFSFVKTWRHSLVSQEVPPSYERVALIVEMARDIGVKVPAASSHSHQEVGLLHQIHFSSWCMCVCTRVQVYVYECVHGCV